MVCNRWRSPGFDTKGAAAPCRSCVSASAMASGGGSSSPVVCLAAARAASGSVARNRPVMRVCNGVPPAAVSMDSRSAGDILRDNRASRLDREERWSGSKLPKAIRSRSRLKDTVGSRSSE